MEADSGRALPDGVLVVRALSQADAEPRRIFRLTTGADVETDPAVAVVSTVQDLHRAIDEWVSTLDR